MVCLARTGRRVRMSTGRLPAAVEASALIRLAEAAGGFAMVLQKGEADSGSILIVLLENQGFGQTIARLFERLPRADGLRAWTLSKVQDAENREEFERYLARRMAQDRDLWIIELTVAQGDQFILNLALNENKTGFMG